MNRPVNVFGLFSSLRLAGFGSLAVQTLIIAVLHQSPVFAILCHPILCLRSSLKWSPIVMDYEVQRSAKCCAATGREFVPGETYYSVLVAEGVEMKRLDYAANAWQGPPEQAVGWWKSQVPDRKSIRKHWAPNDVMLHFWDELAEQPDKRDMRYVLTLLLIRRRVFRLEEEKRDPQGNELLTVYCPRRETTHEVPAVPPEASRIDRIQEELAALLQ